MRKIKILCHSDHRCLADIANEFIEKNCKSVYSIQYQTEYDNKYFIMHSVMIDYEQSEGA